MQVIIMTSDVSAERCLPGFWHQWDKYFTGLCDCVVCGFSQPNKKLFGGKAAFYSIGKFSDYPAARWSDALINVLDNVANETFILMLDDYWLMRPVDVKAVRMLEGYIGQFVYTLKIDLTYDRLYSSTPPGGQNRFYWGFNDYGRLNYLDLIQSDPTDPYHMSLWTGIWRRDNLRSVLVPGETAQQIEMHGGERLKARQDLLILGTRQAPLRHINAVIRGEWNVRDDQSSLHMLADSDVLELQELGYLPWEIL
jgi:hypothetical protein